MRTGQSVMSGPWIQLHIFHILLAQRKQIKDEPRESPGFSLLRTGSHISAKSVSQSVKQFYTRVTSVARNFWHGKYCDHSLTRTMIEFLTEKHPSLELFSLGIFVWY